MRHVTTLLLAASAIMSACASSTSTVAPTIPAAVAATSTTIVPTTSTTGAGGPTVAATTTATPVTSPAPVTGPPPCTTTGTVDETNVEFPAKMSALVGTAIRTGARPCYERVVVEFAPSPDAPSLDLPGYRLYYTHSPVTDSPRGEPVAVRGNAVLVLQMGSWMGNVDGFGYRGPHDIAPVNVSHVRHLLLTENFEGQSAWAIGVDAVYSYTVFTLASPPRLVIDLFTG